MKIKETLKTLEGKWIHLDGVPVYLVHVSLHDNVAVVAKTASGNWFQVWNLDCIKNFAVAADDADGVLGDVNDLRSKKVFD